MILRAIAFSMVLLVPGIALAQPAPREVAERAAKAIEDNYFDPVRGRSIAADLRRDAAAGVFDSLTDPRDLSMELTRRLEPFDEHFNVTYTPPSLAGASPSAAPGGPRMSFPDQVRRGGYGFRRVEMLPGAIGYIDLRMFADFRGADDPARRAADSALALIGDSDAVIIDLRDNGGGSPAMVGYLVSAFTPPDAKVYNVFHSREGTATEAPPVFHPEPRLDVPVFILISGRTGSAAESLAYTLQAAGRATIVGETSGGAANPGGPAQLGDGWSVFVSRGTPVNPITGKNWEGVGVRPDVAVPAGQALARARELALRKVVAQAKDPAIAQDGQWALEGLTTAPAPYAAGDYVGAYGEAVVEAGDGQLTFKRGRRPAWALQPLGQDRFSVVDEPGRRVIFERDAAGRVVAVEILFSTGGGARFRRG
jgi:hypothetical protein